MDREQFVAYMSTNRQYLLRRFGLMSYTIESVDQESLCILATFLNHHRLLGPREFAYTASEALGIQVRSADSTKHPSRIEFEPRAVERRDVVSQPSPRNVDPAFLPPGPVTGPAPAPPPGGVTMTGPEFQVVLDRLRMFGGRLRLSSPRDGVLTFTCRGGSFSARCEGSLPAKLSLSLAHLIAVAAALPPSSPVLLVPDGKNLRIGENGFLVLGS